MRFKRHFFRLFSLASLLPLLDACGGSGDSEALQQAIAVGRHDTVELLLRSQDDKTLFEPGERWQLLAISVDSKGNEEIIDDSVRWQTSAPDNATVSGKGVLQISDNASDGSFDVSASLGGYSASLRVRVSSAALVSIALSPDTDPLPECQSTSFAARGSYTDGSERPLMDGLSWSTNDATLASFDGSLLRSHLSGTVEARVVTGNAVSGNYSLVMTDSLAAITLEPDQPLRLFVRDSSELGALGSFSDGDSAVDITRNGRWRSEDSSVATVDEEGVVSAVAVGNTTVVVACGGLEATLKVSVVAVDGIEIVDPFAGEPLVEEEVRQLALYRTFSDGELDDEDIASEASWSVTAGSSIASIDATGQLTMASDFSGYIADAIRSGYIADAIRVQAAFEDNQVEIELPIRAIDESASLENPGG
jgi:hypothetical protein